MIRNAVSALACSTFALFAAACGAAPEGQEATVGSSAEAVTTSTYCSSQPVPLTATAYKSQYIPGTPADPEEGIKATKGYTMQVPYCVAETLPPPPMPAGGYPTSNIQSCNDGVAEAPPAELALCTAGYLFGVPMATVEAFLCPKNLVTTLPPDASGPGYTTTYFWATPNDGCLGAPVDPTNWAYVAKQTIYSYTTKYPPLPGNCGGACIRL